MPRKKSAKKTRSLVRRNTKRVSRRPKTRSYSYYMNKRFRGSKQKRVSFRDL